MSKSLRALALALSLIMLVGCSGGNNTVITPVEPAAPAANGVPTATDYGSAGYYSEADSQNLYTGDIMPAPASLTDFSDLAPANPAAAPDASAGADMTRGDLTFGIVVGQEAVVNPLNCVYRDLYNVNALVFEGLVELDENYQPKPLLADRWTVEGDVWTFTLRSGILFHNGLELTADDVVASYQEILNNPSTFWYEPVTSGIANMEAADDLTLRVKSAGPGYMLLYAMSFPVVEKGTIGYALPRGTGPYWYIAYDPGNSLRIEANPLWWRRASGYINSLVAICYKTTKAALTGLELGEVDAIATDYPTASLSRSLEDRMTLDYSTYTYECIVPNLRDSILSDINVRQALMYAVDRTSLGDTVYAGMVQESEVPVIPGSWLYDPQAARYNYSPERALQLLYEAGWADADQNGILEKEVDGSITELRLSLITYDRGTTSTRSEAAAAIAEQLKLVGIAIDITVLGADEVLSSMDKGKFDLALTAFELSQLPNLSFLLAGNGKSNFERYANSDMDGYLLDAYRAATETELKESMSGLQKKVSEDLPILGLFFRAGVMISRKSMGGLGGIRQGDVLRGLATAKPSA